MSSCWLAWTIIGSGPLVALIYLGIRALVNQSDISRLAYISSETIFTWIMPALAVLATIPLRYGTNLPPVIITLLACGQLLIYNVLGFVFRLCLWLTAKNEGKPKIKQYFLWMLHSLLPSLAITIALVIRTADKGFLFQNYPDLHLFIVIGFASYLVSGVSHKARYSGAKMPRLAPCELYNSVVRLAANAGRNVAEVRILKNMPYRYINAMAYAGEGVLLSEDLINNLTKKEVDAVIAHEIGHIADEKMWNLGTQVWIIMMLVCIGVFAGFTRLIAFLPACLFFLHYVNWMALFFVPKLVYLWYCRWRESIAEHNVKSLGNPEAIISADYKLYVMEKYPIDSPWWWNIICSHPAPRDRFRTAARLYNLSDADIDCITARAETELREPPADKYEIVCLEETEAPVLKREYKRWHKAAVVTVSIVIGIGALVGFPLAGASLNDSDIYIAIGFIVGMVACALALLLPIHFYENSVTRAYRRSLESFLQVKYPNISAQQMILAEVTFFGDYDNRKKQGAWIGVIDNDIAALGQSTCLSIPAASVISISCWTDPRSHLSSAVCVVIFYMIEGMQQWITLLPMSGSKNSEPRNSRQLERHLRDILAEAGAPIASKKHSRVPIKGVAVRLLLALFMLIAILALVEIICRTAGCKPFTQFWPYFIVVPTAIPALWAWAFRTSATKTDHPSQK